jgi:hypothetical protein
MANFIMITIMIIVTTTLVSFQLRLFTLRRRVQLACQLRVGVDDLLCACATLVVVGGCQLAC